MIVFQLLVVILIVLIIKFQLHKRRINKYFQHLSKTPQIPWFGVAHRFIFKSTAQGILQLINLGNAVESPTHFWFGPLHILLISKPEDLQVVLNSPNCLDKSSVYTFFGIQNGLFSSPSSLWKVHRKLINPTFNLKILHSFIPIFNEKTKILIEILQNVEEHKMFDISKYMFACTLDMISATTMGFEMNAQKNQNVPFFESLMAISEMVAFRMFNPWLYPNFIYYNTSFGKTFDNTFKILWNLPKNIRKMKEKEFTEKNELSEAGPKDDEKYRKPQIFIKEALKLYYRGQIDDISVDEEVLTVLIGGNETSALTISNVILMLAIYPEIQEKAYQEVRSIYVKQESYTDIDEISKLEYIEMVIKETMRLFSVGPFLGRQCTVDTKLEKCTIPAGTLILMAFYNLHRDPKIWGANANKFNPDNFLPENSKNRHPYAFLPFSGGPRNCIGIKYAWISLKIMLAAIVRKFKFSTDVKFEEIAIKWDITLKLVNNHMVKIERRLDY